MKRILVTGGAGFIGFNVAGLLAVEPGDHISIVDDLSKGGMDEELRALTEKDNVTFYNLDLTDPATYHEIGREYDQIYHLAAVVGVRKVTEDPDVTVRVNALSTIYLLEHARRMKSRPCVLFTSSSENYAGSIRHCGVPIPTPEDVPLCIDDITNPRWSYAASKILGEIACYHYARKYGFSSVIVRYHNVYGPRMGTRHVIPEFILRLADDPGKLEMFGGDQYRTFCYVTDAARMTINLMNCPGARGKVVNVGSDQELRIVEIGRQLSHIMGIRPGFVERGSPDGSIDKRIPDLSRIRELGAYVSEVPFSEGLMKTYLWYRQNVPGTRAPSKKELSPLHRPLEKI